jgi:hypothetical protein
MQLRRTDRGFADRGLGLARLLSEEGGRGTATWLQPQSLTRNQFTRSLLPQIFAMVWAPDTRNQE